MTERESKEDLFKALQGVVDGDQNREVTTHAAPPRKSPPQRRWGLILAAVLVWGVLAGIWIVKPRIIFDPDGGEQTLTPTQAEATARYALYLQRSRIAEFVLDSARLPSTLEETGDVEEGVSYHPMPGGFVLEHGGLRLSDRMDVDSFLGDALRQLPRPGGQ